MENQPATYNLTLTRTKASILLEALSKMPITTTLGELGNVKPSQDAIDLVNELNNIINPTNKMEETQTPEVQPEVAQPVEVQPEVENAEVVPTEEVQPQ